MGQGAEVTRCHLTDPKARLHSPSVVNKQLCDLGIPRHVGESQGGWYFSDGFFRIFFELVKKDHRIS